MKFLLKFLLVFLSLGLALNVQQDSISSDISLSSDDGPLREGQAESAKKSAKARAKTNLSGKVKKSGLFGKFFQQIGEMHWGLQVAVAALVLVVLFWSLSTCGLFKMLRSYRWMDGTPSCIKNCPTPGSSYGKLGIDLIVTIHKLQHTMLGGTKLYRVRLEAGNEKVHTSWTKGQWEEQHNLHIDPTCTKLKIFLVKGAGFARAVVACAKLDIKQEILDRRFPQSVIVPLMQDGKEICQLNFSFALQPKSTQALPSGLLRLLKEAAAREKETRASQVKGVSTARSTASWVAKGRSRPSPALIPSNDPMWVKSLGKNLEDAPASTQIGTVSERTSLLSNGIDESPMRRKKYASTVSSEVSDNDRSRSRADSDMSLSKKQLLSDPKVVAQTCCGYLKKAGFGGWMQTRYFAIIPGKKPSEHWQLAWWESIERFRSGQTPRNSVSVMTIDSIQPAIQPNEFSIHFKAYEGDNKAPPHKVIVLSANCTDSRPRDVWMEALQYFLVVYKNARQQLLYRQIQQKQATIPEHDVSDSGSNASSRPRAISRAATLPTLSPAGIPESSPYLTVERRKSTVSPQSQPLPPVRSNIQRHNSLTSIGLGSCHASPMLEPQPAGPGHLRGRPTITPRHTPVMRPTPRDPPNSWRTPSLAPSVMDQDALVFTPLSELESLSKLESERVGKREQPKATPGTPSLRPKPISLLKQHKSSDVL